MAVRVWRAEPVKRGDGSQARIVVRCLCGATDSIYSGSHSRQLPPDAVVRMFKQRGWAVGKTGAGDQCPSCSTRKVAQTMSTPNTPPTGATVVPMIPAADPPRQPTKEESRIVFLKLNEVYEGEGVGYSAGWSDKRVAQDLGVPRIWVEDVRRQFFGDARDSEDIRAALQKAAELAETLKELHRDHATLLSRMNNLQEALNGAADKRAELDTRIGDAVLQMKRLERDISDLRKMVA